MPHLLAAPDKFRSSASAAEVAEAMAAGGTGLGWTVSARALSDGGEGLLDPFGGANRMLPVTGPHGEVVNARWRLEDGPGDGRGALAVIEMAEAAGLQRAGGAGANNAVNATTGGVGELVAEAIRLGARTVIVGCGGSATTDGGAGAVAALTRAGVLPLRSVRLVAACDVNVRFIDAAAAFGPQKGATPDEVLELQGRLERQAALYRRRFGIDVRSIAGSGAAGGLAGGLGAIGAELRSGLGLVAELTGLADEVARADAIVTGEGLLDEHSFNGKVVGEIAKMAAGRPRCAVTGRASEAGRAAATAIGLEVLTLVERFGEAASYGRTLELVERLTADWLRALRGRLGTRSQA